MKIIKKDEVITESKLVDIFKTMNIINGKIYIGRTERDDPKYLGSGVYLKFAIKKWGKENFIRETIEINVSSDRESYWIKEYNSQDPKIGYNIAYGGEGSGKMAEATKKKIGDAQKGSKNHNFIDGRTKDKEYKNEYYKQYYKDNRDEILAKYEDNRDEILAKQKEHRQIPEIAAKKREYDKQYYENYKER